MIEASTTQDEGRYPLGYAQSSGSGAGSAEARDPSGGENRRTEALRILLIDDAGHTVQGARVLLEARQVNLKDSVDLSVVRGLLDPISEHSNAHGEAVFHDLSDVTYKVSVQRDGLIGRVSIEARSGDDLVISLRRGRTFKGQVLDAVTKVPVVGALVRVAGVDWNRREVTRSAGETDAFGRFEIAGVGDHGLEVLINAPWYPEFRHEFSQESDGLVFRLHPAPRGAFGRLVDSVTGEPVSGARVRSSNGETLSADDGRFLLAGIGLDGESRYQDDGTALVSLEALHPDYASRSGDVAVPVEVPAGETRTVNVKTVPMTPRPSCSGRVSDDCGRPVRDALVVLALPGSNLSQASVLRAAPRVRTAVDGSFVFKSFPGDLGALQLVVLATGFVPTVTQLPGTPQRNLELTLGTGLDLALKVPSLASGNRVVALDECVQSSVGPRTTLRRRTGVADEQGRVCFIGVRSGPVRVVMPGGGVMDLDVSPAGAPAVVMETRISG
ncbi:MAG: carboxypeptidase regulatory-like domain-containing protein [Planctomycetes bacterium]|nr:carboxypeptidase regulatory-like domain-containing protein [Planctomycetota bacterium]